MVFKEYDKNIQIELVQCEIAATHAVATATISDTLAYIAGEETLQKRPEKLIKQTVRLTQIVKHTIAPYWCKPPSDEKDGQNTDGIVDWYKTVAKRVDALKVKRRKERARKATMTKEELEEYEFNKIIKISEYRI